MGIIKKAILGAIFGIIVHRVLLFLKAIDITKVVYNLEPGPCRNIPGIEFGAADIQVLSNGLAFISTGLKLTGLEETEAQKRRGMILLYNLDDASSKAKPLTIVSEVFDHTRFNPHGLSIWQDPVTGNVILFVINHLPYEEYVEIFQFDPTTSSLNHLKSVFSQEFKYLADIVALSADTFYVTNFAKYDVMVEFVTQLSFGSVVYYDGEKAHTVLTGLSAPHGIARKGNNIYVTTKNDKNIHVFGIEQDHNLTLSQTLYLGSSCYNIDISTTKILIGCEPASYLLFYGGYLVNPSEGKAPSQVLSVQLQEDGNLYNTLTLVYSDDGNKFSASNIAVGYKGKIFIGSLYTKMLQCDILHV